MAYKLINASAAKPGTAILVDNAPCIVRSNDISKTGKHGHSKCRIEAIGIVDDKKRVFVTGGHERLECPMISKSRAQILSIAGDSASVMNMESFETLELPMSPEIKAEVKEEDQVEYWDIDGQKVIKRKV